MMQFHASYLFPVLFSTVMAAAQARADSLAIARDFPEDGSWKELIIRGDAAKFLYTSLGEAPEMTVTRHDGTTFLVRSSTAMGCSRSDRFGSPRYICVSFVKADGTTSNGYLDPEYGAVARIGVGN